MTLTHLEARLAPYGEPTTDQLTIWCQAVDDAICLQLDIPWPGTTMMVHSPYDDIYYHYAVAQLENGRRQYGDYTNAMAHYNSLFQAYCGYYRRNHIPKTIKSVFL